MSTPLTEVREADAPPATTAIYDSLRGATGTPQVNLIWRHFATEPDVLAWAWESLAPAYASGLVAARAAALLDSVRVPDLAPIWKVLPAAEAAQVRDTLAFYERGNGQNLVGLTALAMMAREGRGAPDGAPEPAPHTWPPIGEIPPLPRLDALQPETRAVVDGLTARHTRGAAGVTPSMYLHLAAWPHLLAAVDARLAPRVGTRHFDARVADLMGVAQHHARALTTVMAEPATRPPEARLAPMLATLDSFVSATIPQMVVVGALLIGDGG